MPRSAPPLEIPPKDRRRLRSWTRSGNIPATLALRARIILLAGHGYPNAQIAAETGVSRSTVILWRDRYACGPPVAAHHRRGNRQRLEEHHHLARADLPCALRRQRGPPASRDGRCSGDRRSAIRTATIPAPARPAGHPSGTAAAVVVVVVAGNGMAG